MRKNIFFASACMLLAALVLMTGCYPSRQAIPVDGGSNNRPDLDRPNRPRPGHPGIPEPTIPKPDMPRPDRPRPARNGHGTLNIRLQLNSNVDWAWVCIHSSDQRIEQKINRGEQKSFRLEAGKSYTITLKRETMGDRYEFTRKLSIEAGRFYRINHRL